MRLLVTRAADETGGLDAQLEALGHEVISAPLLDIAFLPVSPPDGASAIIVTSKNALRAIERSGWLDDARHLPLYCPGRGTAELARLLGFRKISEGAGDAASIPALIGVDGPKPGANAIAYYCADATAFDMEAALSAMGANVRKYTAYRARPARILPLNAEMAIRSGALDGVILLSPRTAGTYRHLVEEAGLENKAVRVPAYCISSNTAAKLKGFSATAHIAASPSVDALLALLPE